MEDYLRSILDLSQMMSLVLYEELGMESHPADRYQDEYRPRGDASLILQRLQDHDKALERFQGF